MEQKQPPEYLICAIATTAGNTSCTLTFLSTWKIVLSPPLTSVNIIPSGHDGRMNVLHVNNVRNQVEKWNKDCDQRL